MGYKKGVKNDIDIVAAVDDLRNRIIEAPLDQVPLLRDQLKALLFSGANNPDMNQRYFHMIYSGILMARRKIKLSTVKRSVPDANEVASSSISKLTFLPELPNEIFEVEGFKFHKLSRVFLPASESDVRHALKLPNNVALEGNYAEPQFKTEMVSAVLNNLGVSPAVCDAYEGGYRDKNSKLRPYRLVITPRINDLVDSKIILFSEQDETVIFVLNQAHDLDLLLDMTKAQIKQQAGVRYAKANKDLYLWMDNLMHLILESTDLDNPITLSLDEDSLPVVIPEEQMQKDGSVEVFIEDLSGSTNKIILQRLLWYEKCNGFSKSVVTKNIQMINSDEEKGGRIYSHPFIFTINEHHNIQPLYEKRDLDLITLKVNRRGEVNIKGRRAVNTEMYARAVGMTPSTLWKLANLSGCISVYEKHPDNPPFCRVHVPGKSNKFLKNVYWADQIDYLIELYRSNKVTVGEKGLIGFEGFPDFSDAV